MEKISANVYVETGFPGCNTGFVVTSEGVVVIDTPMVPEDAQQWRQEAVKHGPVLYVINTEPHTDHAAGNYWFDARVVAHEGTRQAILEAKVSDLVDSLRTMAPNSAPLDPAFHYRVPEITFSQKMSLHLGQHTFNLINLPGHTASETAVYIPEEKVVFTGDNLNLGIPIFIKSLPDAWLDSLTAIKQLDVEKIVPGHGQVSDKSCIELMRESILYWVNGVKMALEKGWSLEETLEKNTLAERYPMIKQPPLNVMARNSIIDLYQYLTR